MCTYEDIDIDYDSFPVPDLSEDIHWIWLPAAVIRERRKAQQEAEEQARLAAIRRTIDDHRGWRNPFPNQPENIYFEKRTRRSRSKQSIRAFGFSGSPRSELTDVDNRNSGPSSPGRPRLPRPHPESRDSVVATVSKVIADHRGWRNPQPSHQQEAKQPWLRSGVRPGPRGKAVSAQRSPRRRAHKLDSRVRQVTWSNLRRDPPSAS